MKNLIIFCLLIITSNIFSQALTKKGRVLNSSDNSAISSANIFIIDSNVGTSSNELGYFVLVGTFTSNDIVRISHIGFETKEIAVSKLLTDIVNDIFLDNKIIISQTVLVKGSIGKEGFTPISFSKLKRDDFESSYTNQDIPEMLSYLPSTTFYSENGNGIGYNYLSIRGFDQRRISVSINGIPQNDPEDHNVYWLDFPDLLESTELIQVQRGSGSGIIGYPAVGGSINIITSTFSDKPRFDFSSSIGNYNTRKYSAVFSSGLISNKYSVYAKTSQLLSSGYRNSSWIDFKSFHLSAARYDDNLTTQINIYGGPVADGLAYTGLPKFAIKDLNLRKENYSYWEADENKYLYTSARRPDEIENFSQPHFELLNEYNISKDVVINSALFLVLGNGFFDYDGSWADTNYFRLTKENGFHPTTNPGNALIRANVENKQWGWIPRLKIVHSNGELIIGGEARIHRSIHWGSINYGENLPRGITKDYRYYFYNGSKDILSFYLNENYQLNDKINLLLEAQMAYHNYKIENEKYLNNNFSISGLFFNPRFGINYKFTNELSSYMSVARVTREPRLKNYYDAAESSGGAVPQFEIISNGKYDFTKPKVKPETMLDIELGTNYNSKNLSACINLFYMTFQDEIVKNGQLDRFGQPVTGNMDNTIHYGIEGAVNYKLENGIELIVNGTLSKNHISQGYEYIDTPIFSSMDLNRIDLSNNRISGFPDYSFNFIIKYQSENFFAQLSNKYVGKFYTDNYDENLKKYLLNYPGLVDYIDNKVDSYFVANLFASYEISAEPVVSKIKFFFQVNNLFNNLYAAYGIGKEFFPAAERNILVGFKVGI